MIRVKVDHQKIGLLALPSMAKAVQQAADFEATMAKIMASLKAPAPKQTGRLKP